MNLSHIIEELHSLEQIKEPFDYAETGKKTGKHTDKKPARSVKGPGWKQN